MRQPKNDTAEMRLLTDANYLLYSNMNSVLRIQITESRSRSRFLMTKNLKKLQNLILWPINAIYLFIDYTKDLKLQEKHPALLWNMQGSTSKHETFFFWGGEAGCHCCLTRKPDPVAQLNPNPQHYMESDTFFGPLIHHNTRAIVHMYNLSNTFWSTAF
jgi:hypothetical protein